MKKQKTEMKKTPVKTKSIQQRMDTKDEKPQTSQGGILQDPRFQHLVTDPRFKNLPVQQRKVKIDKRFQGMFTDNRFQVKYTVDKYGRRVNTSTADDLKKYYELDSAASDSDSENEAHKLPQEKAAEEEDSEAEEVKEKRKEEQAISRDVDDTVGKESDDNDSLASDGEEIPKTLRARLLDPEIDYARGQGRLLTDSSSDDESTEDEDDQETYIDHVWGELDADADTTDESTRRLAVCNMDWDRIRAADLMVLFTSFLPPGGSILSVRIYPSQFGKERMVEEERNGPPELVEGKEHMESEDDTSDSISDDDLIKEQHSDAEEGDEYHMEKLRQYQLNRLRYYYAVVECDSVTTADRIYKECDGIEYESSATRVDLRFIPDDTTFDEDEPTDECTELPDIGNYKPRQFTTTALQQAKVDLTWDETALERRELGDKLLSGKLNEVDETDLKKIVAFSSEEEDGSEASENEHTNVVSSSQTEEQTTMTECRKPGRSSTKKENVIAKYKALLAEISAKEKEEKEKKYEMEFTWAVNDAKDKENSLDQKPKDELTPIEKVMLKRNERNKKRKEERKKRKLKAKGIDPEDVNSDSDYLPDDIDMNDPYFAEEFANGDYVDPREKMREKEKLKKKLKMEQEKQDHEEAERQEKELRLLLDEDDIEQEGKKHFSLKKIIEAEDDTKSKRKRRKLLKKSKNEIAESLKEKDGEDNFQLNVNDERFAAIYKSHEFNIDPTDSHFKKTKGMERIIEEKLKRRYGDDNAPLNVNAHVNGVHEPNRPKKQLENVLLVKSLKRKLQLQQNQQKKNH